MTCAVVTCVLPVNVTPLCIHIAPCATQSIYFHNQDKKELFAFPSKQQNTGMKRPFRDLPANDQRQAIQKFSPDSDWTDMTHLFMRCL